MVSFLRVQFLRLHVAYQSASDIGEGIFGLSARNCIVGLFRYEIMQMSKILGPHISHVNGRF